MVYIETILIPVIILNMNQVNGFTKIECIRTTIDAIDAKARGIANENLLCHYQYYPEFTELTDDEFDVWHSLSKEIGQQKAIIDSTLKKDPNADVSYFRKKMKDLKKDRALNLKKRTSEKSIKF